MGISLVPLLKLVQEISLEQRLELKQELVLKVQMMIPEFEEFITFEEDEDIGLLQESFPFMLLHELNHPLYSNYKLMIPDFSMSEDIYKGLNDGDIDSLYHHATEVGIDKGAILVGTSVCGMTLGEMIDSHAAITERVFRDMKEKTDAPYGFVARLDAEVRLHYDLLKDSIVKSRLSGLKETAAQYVAENMAETRDVYEKVIQKYSDIYRGTAVSPAALNGIKNKVGQFGFNIRPGGKYGGSR